MTKFEELLNSPLPSASKTYTESTEESVSLGKDMDMPKPASDSSNKPENKIVLDSGKATEAGESDDYEDERKSEDGYAEYRIDYSGEGKIDNGELVENSEAEECGGRGCGEEGCKSECGLLDSMPAPAPVETPTASGVTDAEITTSDNFDVKPDTTPLTPEQNVEVDRFMDTVATPLLISGSASPEEINEFVESVESDIAVGEGFLTERTIVRFDKNAKKAQLFETAVAAIARSKNDPLYKKLQTVYKMERIIKAKLRKKYHSEADRKVKEWMARAKKSKSGFLSKIVSKLTGK